MLQINSRERSGSRSRSNSRLKSSQHLASSVLTMEEVKEWCEKLLEKKFQYLSLEIAENTNIIRELTEKLSHNERELERKEKLIQALINGQSVNVLSTAVQVASSKPRLHQEEKFSSQVLEGRLTTINNQLRQLDSYRQIINQPVSHGVTTYQTNMEAWMEEHINRIKQYIKQRCNAVKRHNIQYWGKIKSWLELFEQKQKRCQGAIGTLYEEIQRVNIGEESVGLYRVRNFNVRMKEVEQAVSDMEETYKLAAETQGELRDVLWFKDQESFMDSRLQLGQIPILSTQTPAANISIQRGVSLNKQSPQILNDAVSEISPLLNKDSIRSGRPFEFDLMDFARDTPAFTTANETQIINREPFAPPEPIIEPIEITDPLDQYNRKKSIILATIEEKKLQNPLPCYLDELEYLKTGRSEYFLDQQYQMVKMNKTVFQKLVSDGILTQMTP